MDEKHCECCKDDCRSGSGGASILYKGLAAMFILIGLAIFVSALLGVILNKAAVITTSLGMGTLWNIVELFFCLWVLCFIFKVIFRGFCRRGCGCCWHGRCSCGNGCNCGCDDDSVMSRKEKTARRR